MLGNNCFKREEFLTKKKRNGKITFDTHTTYMYIYEHA